ncbi:hypothetical protein [Psychromonas sp. Urea-02u-13]|uniref:hypothetical protein n=1 Tax=Psychromonas sp. Urea-02u-13 TaxID=2058326 RepID=UPI000C33382B|nr:hypothetical protein [Psychromonas sp. Urea-02u-13]PKG39240.1 hypothetical protein CXF74_09375 [Psychromonas sp. Urea-02u-13]
MKLQKSLTLGLMLTCASSASFAVNEGTAGLTGAYVGDYQLDVINSSQQVKAKSLNSYSWSWDFDNKTIAIDAGKIYKNPFKWLRFNYFTTTAIPFIDNGDGTYTANYQFRVNYPFYYNPKAQASTTFKIVEQSGSLTISSVDIELDGTQDGSPGTRMQDEFPEIIQLNWHGAAQSLSSHWQTLTPAELWK